MLVRHIVVAEPRYVVLQSDRGFPDVGYRHDRRVLLGSGESAEAVLPRVHPAASLLKEVVPNVSRVARLADTNDRNYQTGGERGRAELHAADVRCMLAQRGDMVTITPAEDDYQVLLDVIAPLLEDVITGGARAALDEARRHTLAPGGAVRIIEFPTPDDCHSLRAVLEDFLEHGAPTSQQKHVLRRMVPQLYAAR